MLTRSLLLYLSILQLSFLSFGGIYPLWAFIEDEMVVECHQAGAKPAERDKICRQDFNTIFTLSYLVPGPRLNGASIVGYEIQGFTGMVLFILAGMTPGLVLIPILMNLYVKYQGNPWVKNFFRGTKFGIILVLTGFLANILVAFIHGAFVKQVMAAGIFALTFSMSYFFRINPLIIVMVGAAWGYIFL